MFLDTNTSSGGLSGEDGRERASNDCEVFSIIAFRYNGIWPRFFELARFYFWALYLRYEMWRGAFILIRGAPGTGKSLLARMATRGNVVDFTEDGRQGIRRVVKAEDIPAGLVAFDECQIPDPTSLVAQLVALYDAGRGAIVASQNLNGGPFDGLGNVLRARPRRKAPPLLFVFLISIE